MKKIMMLSKCLFGLVLLLAVRVQAGDKSATHLTGNPRVDFFAGHSLAQHNYISVDTLPVYLSSESNNKDKSPWVAGLLSLAVPGAGEWYAESKLKGAIFFGIEVASWVTAYIYDKKGDHQTDVFQDYADQHYSAARYALWTLNHVDGLNSNIINPYNPGGFRETYINNIFPPNGSDSTCGPPYPCMNWSELNQMEIVIASGSNNGYSHQMPHYGEQQYFELIGKYPQFFSGWDEFPPGTLPSDIANQYNFTFPQQRFYADMRVQANNYYDIASTFVSVAIINHVVSALDAYWSATQYNTAFHAEVDMRIQRTPLGMVPTSTAKIRYTF